MWALAGLVAGILGAVLLALVTQELFKASDQYDGIQAKDWTRVKWVNRGGWLLIASGFFAQAMSVLLSGE